MDGRRWDVLLVGTLAVCAAAPAGAQVEPHRPLEILRAAEIPAAVTDLPPLECRDVGVPMPEALRPASGGTETQVDLKELLGLKDLTEAGPRPGGDPRADSFERMAWLPKAVVMLARAGLWKRAAEAGDRLLKEPKAAYGDFTWDLAGTAAAWAWVQLGDLGRASVAHGAAAARMDDPDIRKYHQMVAGVLKAPGKTADEMKDFTIFRTEVRKQLLPLAEEFKKSAGLVRTASSTAARVRALNEAYKKLRLVSVAEGEIAQALASADFIPAADSLMTDTVPPLLQFGGETVGRLEALDQALLPRSRWGLWNEQVTSLWATVRDVKRLSRLHDYLARQGLATPGKAGTYLVDAHRLLFAADRGVPNQPPEERTLVYQTIGQPMPGGVGIDARKRIPCTMTKLRPM